MAWFELTLDSVSQSALNQHTQALALLATSIKLNGDLMATAIDNLTAELTKFTQTEATLAAAVQAVVKALQDDAAKIEDLTAQLVAANNSQDTAAINALIPQFDTLSDKFTADAATLQSAAAPPQP